MVRKLILGARQHGKTIFIVAALLAVGLLLVISRKASASTAPVTFWDLDGVANPACACGGCGSCGPYRMPGNVSALDGTVQYAIPMFTEVGRGSGISFGVAWDSAVLGKTQFGAGVLCSAEASAEEATVMAGSPPVPVVVSVNIRTPSGAIHSFTKSGGLFTAATCGDTDVLTVSGGLYVLTDKFGGISNFDAYGMMASTVDTNGNTTTYSHNSSRQLTSITDDRGVSYSVSHDVNGYVSSVSDPWTLAYDSNDNLTTITSPASADQGGGVTTTLYYDGSNRLTSVVDPRGNTAISFTYVSSSRQVASATIDGHAISYSYGSGYTDCTDRNGTVHRWYYSGNQVTKTCLRISSADAYATEYRYSGNDLVTVVYPRGNRLDITRDGSGNVTERRRKTTDTGSTDPSDIVESWGYTYNFMTSHTDPLGNVTSYTRDGHGNVTAISYPTVTHPATQSSVTKAYTYNAYGQRTQETDEEGKVTTWTYFTSGDNVGLLQKVEVDPSGLDLTTTFGYDAHFNVNSVTDPRGHETTTTWDGLRRRIAVVPPATNYETDWHYDANGNVTEVDVHNVDKDGVVVGGNPWLTTSYSYTLENRVSQVTEEIDSTHTRATAFFYDNNGNRTRVTMPEGNEDAWTFNSRDLVATHVRGYGAGGASTETYAYDDNANLTTLTDGRSNSTTYTFDLFDRRTKTTNALSNYEEQDYDKAGNVTEIRRKDNANVLLQRSTRSFDERNRHWQTSDLYKDPGATYSDAVTTTERWKTGAVKKTTNARSKDTTYAYDNAWRLVSTTDAMGNVFANTPDASGNRAAWSTQEADGGSMVTHTYEADFDALNRLTEKREIDRTDSGNVLTTTYAFDSQGNMCFTVNAEGNPTRFTFDGLKRMTKKEVALAFTPTIDDFTSAITTQCGFDKNDRLVSFKDDAANESTWAYDALDRQTTMTYPTTSPAQTVSYSYDANGNVTSLTDPAGNVIADTFDSLNRNTARAVTLQTGWLDTTAETRSFDALNRMTLNQDDDYKVEYTYAVNGLFSQVYEEKQSYATGSAYLKTVTKTFNELGDKASETYPNGLPLAYSYNDIGAYSSISDGTNTIASWTYLGQRPKVLTYQNGTTATTTYTGFRGEIAMIKHETSTPTTILELDYGYNKVHDRTFERYGASGSAGDAFAYDKAERLTTAWMGSTTPSNPTGTGVTYTKKIDYNMDDDGNRTSVVVTPYGVSPTTTSYTTNNLNQYTAVGSASPTHDANGNETDNGTYKFKYNYKNLIAEVRLSSNNNLVATYKYDAGGRRVEKAVSGGITERYIYSAPETVETYNGSNAWKQSFVFGQGIDNVLMLEQADVLDFDSDSNTTEITRAFYHRNALGSVIAVTDLSQVSLESYRYTPYGEPTITRNSTTQSSDPLGQHWAFGCRYNDEECTVIYSRARVLSALLGRFVQRDPLGISEGPSLFEYAHSSPANYSDPTGMCPPTCKGSASDTMELPISCKDAKSPPGPFDLLPPDGDGSESTAGNGTKWMNNREVYMRIQELKMQASANSGASCGEGCDCRGGHIVVRRQDCTESQSKHGFATVQLAYDYIGGACIQLWYYSMWVSPGGGDCKIYRGGARNEYGRAARNETGSVEIRR